MYVPMPPRRAVALPRTRPPSGPSSHPLQDGLIDAFIRPRIQQISGGAGLTGAWGAALSAAPQSPTVGAPMHARKPPGNFRRLSVWDPVIGAQVPLIVDKAGNYLHPTVAGLIDELVAVDPNSDEQVNAARLRIDRELSDGTQTVNHFQRIFSDYLAGDLTPDEARAEYADRGDERFRENRRLANWFVAGILAAGSAGRPASQPSAPRSAAQRGPHRDAEEPVDLPAVSHTKNPMTAAEYNALPETGMIDPRRIRTLQDSVGQRFRPLPGESKGRHIKETIDELKASGYSADIGPIRIVEWRGAVWALDHRRLVAARSAGVPVRYQKVDAVRVVDQIGDKATTIDDGMSIVIRPEKGTVE